MIMNIMKKINKRNLLLCVSILLIILLIFLISNYIIKKNNSVYFKSSKIDTEIIAFGNYLDAPYSELEIENSSSESKNVELYLTIDDLSKSLLNYNFMFIVTRYGADNLYNELIDLFASNATLLSENEVLLYRDTVPANTKYKYRVYFWLNNQVGNNLHLSGYFNSRLVKKQNEKKTSCTNDVSFPDVKDGMIPVVISNDGVVKTIKSNDKNWYNYCKKEWANVVLVTDSSRKKYTNTSNVTVELSDILGYFVWIPRYSYRIWSTKISSYGSEQKIDIKFINKRTKNKGTKVNNWYTHPAFTFGNIELSGIWVGKFEMTGSLNKPTVLPNQSSLVNYNVSEYFKSALLFAGGNIDNNIISNTASSDYGLSKKVNSHMIKNSEWGAVTYLSMSKYGISDKIRINNYRNETTGDFLTGCGAYEWNEYGREECDIVYGRSVDYPQSTTGNISGIFDMSGGTGEYMMSYVSGQSLAPVNNLSGFDDNFFTTRSNQKYFDVYPINIFNKDSVFNAMECTLETCGGHALFETYGWFNSIYFFPHKDNNFIKRGCGNYSYVYASQFCYGYGTGEGGKGTSSRVVLITE